MFTIVSLIKLVVVCEMFLKQYCYPSSVSYALLQLDDHGFPAAKRCNRHLVKKVLVLSSYVSFSYLNHAIDERFFSFTKSMYFHFIHFFRISGRWITDGLCLTHDSISKSSTIIA